VREPGSGEFGVLDAVFAGLSRVSWLARFHARITRRRPFVRDGRHRRGLAVGQFFFRCSYSPSRAAALSFQMEPSST
jgi:hypothetical protein